MPFTGKSVFQIALGTMVQPQEKGQLSPKLHTSYKTHCRREERLEHSLQSYTTFSFKKQKIFGMYGKVNSSLI
jgi:hypothetical protein